MGLDVRHRVQSETCLARGSLTGVEIHPRDVFRPLIRQATAAVIFCHNHPSGDPAPSRADLELTSRLREVGDLVRHPGARSRRRGMGRLRQPRRAQLEIADNSPVRGLQSPPCGGAPHGVDLSDLATVAFASTARAAGDGRLPGTRPIGMGGRGAGLGDRATRGRC